MLGGEVSLAAKSVLEIPCVGKPEVEIVAVVDVEGASSGTFVSFIFLYFGKTMGLRVGSSIGGVDQFGGPTLYFF